MRASVFGRTGCATAGHLKRTPTRSMNAIAHAGSGVGLFSCLFRADARSRFPPSGGVKQPNRGGGFLWKSGPHPRIGGIPCGKSEHVHPLILPAGGRVHVRECNHNPARRVNSCRAGFSNKSVNALKRWELTECLSVEPVRQGRPVKNRVTIARIAQIAPPSRWRRATRSRHAAIAAAQSPGRSTRSPRVP